MLSRGTDAQRIEAGVGNQHRRSAARRARVILLLANGCSYAIARRTFCSSRTIARCGNNGSRRKVSRDWRPVIAARNESDARAGSAHLTWTRRPPPHVATHWPTRSLGRKLGVQHTVVARAWRHAGLQPHRLERYMRSTDPEFETKAADVIGLYVDPPQHAVVFCVDEKTAIQALDRLDPVLPLSLGRAERQASLPTRDAAALCGAQHADGRSDGPHGGSAHECGIRRLPADRRRDPAASA